MPSKSLTPLLFVLIGLFSLTTQQANSANKNAREYLYVKNLIIIKFKSDYHRDKALSKISSDLQNITRSTLEEEKLFDPRHVKNKTLYTNLGLGNIYRLKLNPGVDSRVIANKLKTLPEVEWAEPVYILPMHKSRQTTEEPNDSLYSKQYFLPQIHAPEGWAIAKGKKTVPIAIIDTGVDWTHPDLKDHIWINPGEDIDSDGKITAADSNGIDDDGNGFKDDFIGWDWVHGVGGNEETDAVDDEDSKDPDNNPMDVNGHGTHCAGLAAATTNNEIGVASVSWGCSIMPLRIGWQARDGNGYGRSDWMAQAFVYAANNGAKVASLSFGHSEAVLEGALYAYLNDAVIVTSAGNENTITTSPLSQVPWAIIVAAVDRNDKKTSYSNYGGAKTMVCAPGGAFSPGLWSTTPNNSYNNHSYYNPYNGTSMATPVVAGLAGLLRSYFEDYKNYQIYYQITETADNIDDKNPDYKGLLGYGRINVSRALTEDVHPKPKLSLIRYSFKEISGDGDDLPEPDETVAISFLLKNEWAAQQNANAKLEADTTWISMIKDEINIESIPGIENLGNNYYSNSDDPFIIEIKDTYPQNVPAKLIVSGNGFSDTFKIEIPISPMILFVDDHLGGGDGIDVPIKSYYDSTFRNLGVSYHYWLNSTSPDSETIKKYPIVVWGCEWAFPSLEKTDRDVLSYYLEQGGNLFISGQDIGWDLCDPSSENNQHYYSSGDSKTWYEKYLSSRYISDAGGINPLTPTDESIFDLSLGSFDFSQPERSENQYPSVIEALGNAYPILQYGDGQTAAIASESPCKVVYFAFGGFEAIRNSNIRNRIMKDILNSFNNIKIKKTVWRNTEFKGPFSVSCSVKSEIRVTGVDLLYRINESPWNVIHMSQSHEDDSTYIAEIPQVTSESAIVEYRVVSYHEGGIYSADVPVKFYSGPDYEPPKILTALTPPSTSVNKRGPFFVKLLLDDNIGIDTNNVCIYLSYNYNGSEAKDTITIPYSHDNVWESLFTVSHDLEDGDSIKYLIEIPDKSSNANKTRFPELGYYTINIRNTAIIENFEADLSNWYNPDNIWQIYRDPSSVQEGVKCLNSGNGSTYPPDVNTFIEYLHPLNLSGRTKAKLTFLEAHVLEDDNDTCFVETSTDGQSWSPVLKIYGKGFQAWKTYEINLNQFCADESEPIKFRFRFQTDSNSTGAPGIFIDLVKIETDFQEVKSNSNLAEKFNISEAYPNPTNSTVCIDISGCRDKTLYINVYNLLGQNVFRKRLLLKTNNYKFTWDFKDSNSRRIPTGIYFIEVRTNNYRKLDKVLLLK